MTPLRVSVVVITYNRKGSLARTLDALAAQDFPAGDFEVIVVSDGSTDGTAEMVRARKPAVQLVEIAHSGVAAARNAGVKAARGGIIAFTDDDCLPRPDWLSRLVAHLDGHPEAAAVGGRTVMSPRGDFMMDYAEAYGFITGPGMWKGEVSFIATCNVAYRKDDIIAAGGFDDTHAMASEDVALSFAVRARGRKLAVEPGAVVEHFHPTGFTRFLRTNFRYGRGEMVRLRHEPAWKNLARLAWRSRRLLLWIILPWYWIQASRFPAITPSRVLLFPIVERLRETMLLAGQWAQFILPKN